MQTLWVCLQSLDCSLHLFACVSLIWILVPGCFVPTDAPHVLQTLLCWTTGILVGGCPLTLSTCRPGGRVSTAHPCMRLFQCSSETLFLVLFISQFLVCILCYIWVFTFRYDLISYCRRKPFSCFPSAPRKLPLCIVRRQWNPNIWLNSWSKSVLLLVF